MKMKLVVMLNLVQTYQVIRKEETQTSRKIYIGTAINPSNLNDFIYDLNLSKQCPKREPLIVGEKNVVI